VESGRAIAAGSATDVVHRRIIATGFAGGERTTRRAVAAVKAVNAVRQGGASLSIVCRGTEFLPVGYDGDVASGGVN
jgi:hypothetical protein